MSAIKAAVVVQFALAWRVKLCYTVLMHVLAYFGSSAHWLIFAIVCLLVFGASRLPDLARNLGKSLGILKKARREFEEELMRAQTPEQQQTPPAPQPPAPQPTEPRSEDKQG